MKELETEAATILAKEAETIALETVEDVPQARSRFWSDSEDVQTPLDAEIVDSPEEDVRATQDHVDAEDPVVPPQPPVLHKQPLPEVRSNHGA